MGETESGRSDRPFRESSRLNLTERLLWKFRLFFFPTGRLFLHLPVKGKEDRDGNPYDFADSMELHDETIDEIESYLKRTLNLSFEPWRRRSGGLWQGSVENNLVFYMDLPLCVREIEWFFKKMRPIWRNRFNQTEIYISVHPIWF